MASEIVTLRQYVAEGIATDKDKARLKELLAAGGDSSAASPHEQEFTFSVDDESFDRGGQRYFSPKKLEWHKSALVDIITPTASDKADQRWFIFETVDGDAGRTALIATQSGEGSFKFKDIFDGIGIPCTRRPGEVMVKLVFPVLCWAFWRSNPKARTLGEVEISQLKPDSAKLEQAI